jgi:hypothetical protein
VLLAAGVDRQHHALRAEHLGELGQQLWARHGSGVHRHLVGSRVQYGLGVGRAAHPASDRERDEHVVGAAAGQLRHGLALLVRRRDVEEDDLVGPLVLVAHRQLDRVAGITQVHELDAFHHAAFVDVQAGDHAPQQHQASASCPSRTPKRPS